MCGWEEMRRDQWFRRIEEWVDVSGSLGELMVTDYKPFEILECACNKRTSYSL